MSESQHPNRKIRPATSYRARDGTLIEMVFDAKAEESALAVYQSGSVAIKATIEVDGRHLGPYSPHNNLLTHRVVLFASEAAVYDTEADLLEQVRGFIHAYVDVKPGFEEVAAHYVLLTWRYDLFKELPYLRVLGNYGQGKSRFLLTVGSICFKPIFASGASTVSPIFRLLDEIGGTLVIDEADFRASDERSEITKILNNGHAEGFPILRSDVTPSKEFSPRAFRIFGPKIIATRYDFEDEALESRCLTETLGSRPLRSDVPITLPATFEDEAVLLRNKLLMYRLRRFEQPEKAVVPSGLAPRLSQILSPLLSVATSPEARERLTEHVVGHRAQPPTHEEAERLTLRAAAKAAATGRGAITLREIAEEFTALASGRYGTEISHRFVGGILRRLGLELQKSGGVYVLPVDLRPRLDALLARYELVDKGDIRDKGDRDASECAGTSRSSPKSLLSVPEELSTDFRE